MTVRYLECPICGLVDSAHRSAAPNPDPLTVPEPQYATIRDRPGITIPLLLAIVVVVAVALAVWGGTR